MTFIRISLSILLTFLYTILFGQIEVPASLGKDLNYCHIFEDSAIPLDVFFHKSGIYINQSSNGNIIRLKSNLQYSTIHTNTYQHQPNIFNQNITPTNAELRFQNIDENSSKIIVTKELDILTSDNHECYDHRFEVIEINGDQINNKSFNLDFESKLYFPEDIIFSNGKYYINSIGTLSSVCYYEFTNHIAIFDEETKEIKSDTTSLNPEFFENQNQDVFFFSHNNNSYDIYSIDENLNYLLLIEGVNTNKIYPYGEDEMILILSNRLDIYDSKLTTLKQSIQNDYFNPNRKYSILDKNIYYYANNSLFKMNETFEESLVYNTTQSLPAKGIFNNGDYTYLWGSRYGNETFIVAIDEETTDVECSPIDSCGIVSILDFEPISMICEVEGVIFDPDGFSFPTYKMTLTAEVEFENNNEFIINKLKLVTKNQTYIPFGLSDSNEEITYISNLNLAPSSSIKVATEFYFSTNPAEWNALDFHAMYDEIAHLQIVLVSIDEYECPREVLQQLDPQELKPLLNSNTCEGITTNNSEVNLSNTISIFPNPASDKLMIKSEEKQLIYELYDIRGSLILKNELVDEINVEGLDAGIYFIKVLTKDKSTILVHKIIKS